MDPEDPNASSSSSSQDFEILNSSDNNNYENESMAVMKLLKDQFALQIIRLLQLNPLQRPEIIVDELRIYGRQALHNHKRDVPPNIFDQQMSNDQSELLQVLEKHVVFQWENQIPELWFQEFLRQRKSASISSYHRVLRRTAEYGMSLVNDNGLLALTLQFLLESGDKTILDADLFKQIWIKVVSEGSTSLMDYEGYGNPGIFKQQVEDDQSTLYLALTDYFEQPLKHLFETEVNITDPEIFKVALGSVLHRGWWNGLHDNSVVELIVPKTFKILIVKLRKYLHSQDIPIPDKPVPIPSVPIVNPVIHNPSEEGQIVIQCVMAGRKLQLSDLVQSGEFKYIDQTLTHVIDKIISDYRSENNFSSFINACHTPIMYLLKRNQNLDEFVKSLFHIYSQLDSSLKTLELSLRLILHVLILNSDMSLSSKIMSLLSQGNPVPFLQPSLSDQIKSSLFVSDIIHVWDYSIPIVLSFGIGQCNGKSTILNKIFLSSFEETMSSIYFKNTIDIDFGYSCLPRRSTNIADAHGSMSESLLKKIHQLFDGFIIHVEYSYLCNNISFILNLLKIIEQEKKYRILIVRDVSNNQHNQCSKLLSSNFSSTEAFILPDVANQNRENEQFIEKLRVKIWREMPSECKHDATYLKNQLKGLIDTEYKEHLDQMFDIIDPLKELLLSTANDQNLIAQSYPEYLEYVELCALKLKLARFNFYENEKDATVHDARLRIFTLENSLRMQRTNQSGIYGLFSGVLNASNILTCLELLRTELKKERTRLISIADMARQIPVEKNLSLEVLWRNAIVCSEHQSENMQQVLQEKYYQFIQAGYPFEIIDGDNFYFQYSFLSKAFEPFRDQETLVISVIGPQNSGKSTLLNFMFGTLFDVRDGRCTRGIYGSFVKTDRSDYKNILLIDTEGLSGIEGGRGTEDDRRIILFCLAVSHVVIVNTGGEVTNTLKSMFDLCTDSLDKIGVTRIPHPIVHFILNKKVDLNIANHEAAINQILSDASKSININQNHFHILPSAFKREGQTSTSNQRFPILMKTAAEFVECAHSVCGKIFPSGQINGLPDPLQWLSSSRTIFDTLRKYPDLTYYSDIHERRLDNDLREHVRGYLTNIFSENFRDQLIRESANKNEQEIHDLFRIKENQTEGTTRQHTEKLFRSLKVPKTLRERTAQFLKIQIMEMFIALRTSTIAVIEREEVRSAVRNGEGFLRKSIEDTIRSVKPMSSAEAGKRFDKIFQETIESIKKKFVPAERLTQAIKHIYANYNIYEKDCLLQHTDITHHLSESSKLKLDQISIDQIKDELIQRFIYLTYQEDLVEANSFNPTQVYSSDMIQNLLYLNKELLERDFRMLIENNIQQTSNAMITTDMFQLKIRNSIRQQKPMILTETNTDDGNMYLATSKIIKEVIERIIKAMQGVENDKVRQIRTERIQTIVGLINSLIIDIDNELIPFCLTLSRPLKSTFHTCAVIFLTKYYYDEQNNYFSQTSEELTKKEKDLREYFINMVVFDADIDKNYAINLGKQFKEHLVKLIKEDGHQIINEALKTRSYLNRKYVQDRCDEQILLCQDVQWLLDYVENPMKIIQQFFEKLWKDIQQEINLKLSSRKSYYVKLFREFLFCVEGMLNEARKLGSNATFVNHMFLSDETNTSNANENLINKKRCMALLFYQCFTQQAIPAFFTHNMETYRLKTEALNTFQLSIRQRKPSTELTDVTEQISSIFNTISIGNFVIFLEALCQQRQQLLEDLDQFKSDCQSNDTQDNYAQLLDKVRGCLDQCPCCKRPCDFDHSGIKSTPGSKDNQHRCLSGHTLRAMNGYKFESNGEPSLLMCEQIKDDHLIVAGSTHYEWFQFKKDHPDWIFDSALGETELDRLHGKYLILWGKVGQKICEKFSMTYVSHNTPQTTVHQREAFHYILLLDASASMEDGRWNDLKVAVAKFLEHRRELGTKDHVTIIVFSDKINTPFEDAEIQNVDVEKIVYLDGLTSFSAAFAKVYDCITSATKKRALNPVHGNLIIVFMTDGEDTYPEQELNQISDDYGTIIKRFWTLALGEDQSPSMTVLEKINRKMNGSFYSLAASADLTRAYIEVAMTPLAIKNDRSCIN